MIYESSNAYSFPHQSKDLVKVLLNPELLKTPIVGKYTKKIINKPRGGYHFNKEEKLKNERPKTPGPGKYNTNDKCFGQCTPKFSMGQKLKDINFNMKKKIPGPGTYTITDSNYEKTIETRKTLGFFCKEPKLILPNNKVPGVGKYELTYDSFGTGTKNKFTFNKSSRKIELEKEEINNDENNNQNKKKNNKKVKQEYYNIKPLFGNEGIKPLLKGRPKEKIRSVTPGPGQYEVDKAMRKTLKRGPVASFGYGKKVDFGEIAKKKNVPGPKYNVSSLFDVTDKNKIHTIKFIKKKKSKRKRFLTPGPGSYYIPCSFANTPLYQSINNKYRKV